MSSIYSDISACEKRVERFIELLGNRYLVGGVVLLARVVLGDLVPALSSWILCVDEEGGYALYLLSCQTWLMIRIGGYT
ncbi:MAG: hypothetical protein QXW41_08295 [Fervidicoccaceae archaeon]